MIELSKEVSMVELDVRPEWEGKNLLELNLRRKYGINVVAIVKDKEVCVNIDPEQSLTKSMKLIVIANTAKLSVYTKDGLDDLKDKMKSIVCQFSLEETEFITNKRQQSCLLRCKEALERALQAAEMEELQDMIYIDLKSALLSLDEITGEVITDDILNNIFDHFCIGK